MRLLMIVFVVSGAIAWGACLFGLVGWKAALVAHLVGFGCVALLRVNEWRRRKKSSKKEAPSKSPDNVISLDDAREETVEDSSPESVK